MLIELCGQVLARAVFLQSYSHVPEFVVACLQTAGCASNGVASPRRVARRVVGGSDLTSRRAVTHWPEQMWCERISAQSILWRCARDFATMCPLLSVLAVEKGT